MGVGPKPTQDRLAGCRANLNTAPSPGANAERNRHALVMQPNVYKHAALQGPVSAPSLPRPPAIWRGKQAPTFPRACQREAFFQFLLPRHRPGVGRLEITCVTVISGAGNGTQYCLGLSGGAVGPSPSLIFPRWSWLSSLVPLEDFILGCLFKQITACRPGLLILSGRKVPTHPPRLYLPGTAGSVRGDLLRTLRQHPPALQESRPVPLAFLGLQSRRGRRGLFRSQGKESASFTALLGAH